MFLKKMVEDRQLTIVYDQRGSMHTCKGRICCLNIKEQTLSLKDETERVVKLHLSEIHRID